MKLILGNPDIKALLQSVRQTNPGRVCAATVNDVWCRVEPDVWAALIRRLEDGRLVLLEPGEPTQTVNNATFEASILPLCVDAPSAHQMPQDIQDLFRTLLDGAAQAQANLDEAEAQFANTLDELARPKDTVARLKKLIVSETEDKTTLGRLYDAVEGLTDSDQIQNWFRQYGYDAKGVRLIAAKLRPIFKPHKERISKAGFDYQWLSYYLPYWTLQAIKQQQPDPGQN
jgi:hypothetical protein